MRQPHPRLLKTRFRLRSRRPHPAPSPPAEGPVITADELRALHAALQKNLARLREAQHLAHMGNWEWNIVTGELWWSDEIHTIFGLSPTDFGATYAAFLAAIHPEDRPRVAAAVEQAVYHRAPYFMEYRICQPTGETRWVIGQGDVFYDAAGQPQRMIGTVQDITEHQRRELHVQKLSLVVEQTADAVVITDPRGQIEYVNPAFETFTGYTNTEAVGQTPSLIKSGWHTPTFYKQLWATITRGEVYRNVLINRRKNGEFYYEEKTITPLKNAAGQIMHFVSIGKNITDRMQSEAQLQRYHEQLRTSLQMGQAVAASLDLATVLDHVTRETLPLIKASSISVLLLENQQLKFVAHSGPDRDYIIGQTMPATAGLAGQALQTHRSRRVSNTQPVAMHPAFQQPNTQLWPRSLLVVPLFWREQAVGVLEAGHTLPDFFKDEDLHLLQAAAAWVALAINNARQHTQLQRRLREANALAEVGRALSTTLDVAQVLQVIVDAAHKVIPQVEHAVIHQLDETQQLLLPVASTSDLPPAENQVRLRRGEGIAGLVAQMGQPINVADIQADPRYAPCGCAQHLRSLLVVPIRSRNRFLGTLSVHSTAVGAFEDEDEALLATLTVNAAIAWHNAQAFANEQRRTREAEALQRITQTISRQLGQTHLLQLVVSVVADVTHYQYVSIFWAETGGLRLIAHRGYECVAPSTFLPRGLGVIHQVLETGRPLWVADVNRVVGYVPCAPDVQSLIAVPLTTGTTITGLLVVEQGPEHPLTGGDLRWLTSVGQQVSLGLENTALYTEQNRLLHEREQTQAQLIHSAKMMALGQLVASLAHEINNPLQAIQGYLTLAQEELAERQRPDKITRYLDISINEIERIAGLMQRMREFYRPARAVTEPTDLHAVLWGVLDLTRKKLEHAKVHLRCQWAETLPLIQATPDHLKQVFLNLVFNSLEAMPLGGELRLSTAVVEWHQAPAACVRVQDTGAGMSPEMQSRIFEPFFTSKDTGTGLGLSVSYGIIQNHHGGIEVDSVAGHGTTFTVYLPIP